MTLARTTRRLTLCHGRRELSRYTVAAPPLAGWALLHRRAGRQGPSSTPPRGAAPPAPPTGPRPGRARDCRARDVLLNVRPLQLDELFERGTVERGTVSSPWRWLRVGRGRAVVRYTAPSPWLNAVRALDGAELQQLWAEFMSYPAQ